MSLVQELQRDAFTSTVPTSEVLRKALVVARKLGVQEFSEWIDLELRGYPEGKTIPEYRQVRGEIITETPFRGAVAVHIESDQLADIMNRFPFHDSVSKIENLVASAGNDPRARISREYPSGAVAMLRQMSSSTSNYPLYFGTDATQLNELLNNVRNIILDWSLKLAEDGILGEGMSFSRQEKQLAESHHHNYGTIIGTMNQSQLQQHTQNSTQNLTNGASLQELGQFVRELEQWLGQSPLLTEDREEAQADLASVQSQLESPKPKTGIIRAGLDSVKSVLEKAAVGAVTAQANEAAQQAQSWIERITSQLSSLPG